MNLIKKIIANKIPIISFSFFFINYLILINNKYIDGGDDIYFFESSLKYSLKNFIIYRYNNWSGRIIPDSLGFLFNNNLKNIWPIVNAFMITILGLSLYKYLLLFNYQINKFRQVIITPLICFSFLLIDKSIINPSYLWITGSINYLWPLVIFFIVFYPYVYYLIKKEYPKNRYFFLILSFLGGILTEQTSFMLIILLTFFFIYFVITHQKLPTIFFITSIFIILGSMLLLLAPGNKLRYQSEIINNFPSFSSLSLANHLSISIYWVFNKIINPLSLTLIPTYLFLGLSNIKNKKNKTINYSLILISLVLIIKNIFNLQFTIYPITSDNIFSIANILGYLLLTISILLLPYSILLSKNNNINKNIYLIILFLIFILMFITTFSPTLDISGNRTLFIPSLFITFTWLSFYLKK